MKKVLYSIPLALIALLTFGCKAKTVYVPVREIQTEIEMLDRWHKDSIYIHDSVFVVHRGDTIFSERYKYIYRDKVVRDSIYVRDSVRVEVPHPVIEVKEVNTLKNWQIVLMCLGGGLIGWVLFRLTKTLRGM